MIQHSIRSPYVHSRAVPLATALIGMCFAALNACPAFGQAGLRESLEQLDRDQDGRIDPEEITPLARPYLERIATAKRLRLDRDTRIEDFQEASRIYHALRNGVSGRGVEVESESSIQPFGPMDEQPVVPEFGLAEIKYPYVQADLDEADRTLRRYDRDDDGRIDRREAARARWTHRDPFSMDLDNDDRLNRLELAQRYARRRLLDGDSDELVQRARRVGNGIESSEPQRRRSEDSSQWWRTGGSRYYLTASVLSRFDKNRNGRLEVQETEALGFPPGRIDVDRDGEITRQELFGFLSGLQDESAGAVEGLPGWFFEMDTNGDGQVEMSEYKPEGAVDRFDQFALLDTNGDGLLTDREVVSSKSMVGGSYENRDAEIMPPGRTIISEIEVPDEFVIGDLNVRVSITHSNTSHLDAYLTGPDGTRIELFTEIGGSGNHFEQTVFDDQSRYPITKAKPPYSGTYLPEGTTKRQPGLSAFNGQTAQGVWQLVIRGTRSDRFGMLHAWSLMFKPSESNGLASDETAPDSNVSVGPRSQVASPSIPSARFSSPRLEEPGKSSSVPRMDPEEIANRKAEWYEKLKARRGTDGGAEFRMQDVGGAETKEARQKEKLDSKKRKNLSPEALERYKQWLESRKGERG